MNDDFDVDIDIDEFLAGIAASEVEIGGATCHTKRRARFALNRVSVHFTKSMLPIVRTARSSSSCSGKILDCGRPGEAPQF
jgi:hypothetical protein